MALAEGIKEMVDKFTGQTFAYVGTAVRGVPLSQGIAVRARKAVKARNRAAHPISYGAKLLEDLVVDLRGRLGEHGGV